MALGIELTVSLGTFDNYCLFHTIFHSLHALNDIAGGEVFVTHSRYLAFQAVAKESIEFFVGNYEFLMKVVEDRNAEKQETEKIGDEFSDIFKLLDLTTNECNPKLEDFVRIRNTLITLFYLNLLKTANYFESQSSSNNGLYQYSGFSKYELLVGAVIEKLLLIPCNM